MNVKISLGAGVSERLQQSTQRQIDYKLGSMSERLAWINVRLAYESPLEAAMDTGIPVFLCRIQTKGSNGEKHEVELRGLKPNVCIADTASRLARAITRRSKRGAIAESARKLA